MYYLFLFTSFTLLCLGFIFLKKPFQVFAYASSELLDCMLDSSLNESDKQKSLIRNLGKMLFRLFLLLVLIFLVICISVMPVLLYMHLYSKTVRDFDTSSIFFYLTMTAGSIVFFVYPKGKKKNNYSSWSVLLHRMILDNYNISGFLFRMDKKYYRKKPEKENKAFVIVTGLARGGTTALTDLLYETGKFHSLSYNNMPLLLAVNIWRIFYNPRKNKLKQRAHTDNILHGYKTIEALEEYFFKVFLKDRFICENNLTEHEISEKIFDEYRAYQKLVSRKNRNTIYLAKNNNFILRYRSLRILDPSFKVILLFRDPADHAYSLLTQHRLFLKKQTEDPFVLEYMNWLGHHEFGLNHKKFDFGKKNSHEHFDTDTVNYWLTIWTDYYSYILSLPEDKNLFLVEYKDLCDKPVQLIKIMAKELDLDLPVREREPYQNTAKKKTDINPELKNKADSLYNKLRKRKIVM